MIAQRLRSPAIKIAFFLAALSVVSFFAGENAIKSILLNLTTIVLTIPLAITGYKLFKDERRFQRQLVDLEMEAYKLDVTAAIIDDVAERHELLSRALSNKVIHASQRSEKLELILSEMPFPDALRFVKQAKKVTMIVLPGESIK